MKNSKKSSLLNCILLIFLITKPIYSHAFDYDKYNRFKLNDDFSLIFEIDMPGPQAYANIVSGQKTWQTKAAACYRFWQLPATVLELAHNDAKRKNNYSKLKKISNSLFNVKIREFFIEIVIDEYSLKELSDKAYALGVGVKFTDKKTPPIIQEICVNDINKALQSNRALNLYAQQRAEIFMENLR